MFEKLLLCTDFSEYIIKISECVPALPGIREIVLLHVFDATHYHIRGWTYNPQIENAKIKLEEQKKHLESFGLQVKIRLDVITSGDIPAGIQSAADAENVSLIVIGARGGDFSDIIFLGSVAGGVLRTTNYPVLVLNHTVVENLKESVSDSVCPKILSKMIFPTDFSQPSHEALDLLKGLTEIGTLVLIHVITEGETAEEIKTLEEDAQQKLNMLIGELAKEGITSISHIRFGNPVDEILQCAKDEEGSLIFLHSRGAGWLHTLLSGEKSIDVVIRAKRPVLVVRSSHNPA